MNTRALRGPCLFPGRDVQSHSPAERGAVKLRIFAKKNGVLVNVKERGRYAAVWVSTTAHGSTIFWRHPQDYLTATGGKSYR